MVSGGVLPFSTGVDYMAMTVREKERREVFGRLAIGLIEEERSRGSEAKPWAFHGYQGLQCGQVQYGTRYEDDCVRVAGSLADYAWEAFYGFSDTVPRIDLQVTVWDGLAVLPRLRLVYEWARSRVGGLRARPVFDLRQNTLGGGTLYVGRRQSAIYGRIYDCGVRHPEPEFQGSIRAEIETHGRRALQLSAALLGRMADPVARAAFVLSWFAKRTGSQGPVTDLQLLLRQACATDHAEVLPCLQRTNVDCLRKLEIARIQWRKSAQTLVRSGFGPELMAALGLRVTATGEVVVT